jgi:hypothetical protein
MKQITLHITFKAANRAPFSTACKSSGVSVCDGVDKKRENAENVAKAAEKA